MDDFVFCGNVVPKFPGGPGQGGLVGALISPALLAALARLPRLEPEPTPWKGLGGISG